MRLLRLVVISLMFASPSLAGNFPLPQVDFETWRPLAYPCFRASSPPVIDGKLDDDAWRNAPWTADFVDIEGDLKPRPRFRTRAKMLWDDTYFYVAADMEEPHLWGTLTERDAVIFYDNDFEVFIDPDGDTHNYYELELNALNTVWDLLLTRPYRDGGHAVDSWDIAGLKTAVDLRGTLNDPSDIDEGWSVEIAMPWKVLEECANHGGPPSEWETWRVNFSRVQWRLDPVKDGYAKSIDPATGKSHREDNWVWSPQGLINMHYPEMWGCVLFCGKGERPGWATNEGVSSANRLHPLRLVYYAQKHHYSIQHEYAPSLEDLVALPERDWRRLKWSTQIHRPQRKAFVAIHSEGIKHHYRQIDHLGLLRTLEAGH